ncbi:MAG: Nif3-like dinuclear metal center hexameric protein [Candidatus Gastranaerophilales bacterium]|nr:Nif3-like dinuclear metal center hexameric protein [Candidatus Gastranaerophilales bacterium]
MIKTDYIISKIEKYASLGLSEPWDNSGWQIDLGHDYTNKVLVALSLTKNVLEQAITNDCDLIITHHPLIFNSIKKINNPLILEAIRNNICVYSAHTNLDKTYGSTTDALCGVLGLQNLVTVEDYIKIAHLKDELAIEQLIDNIKQALNLDSVKLINPDNITIAKNIAVCAGAGGGFIDKLRDYDVDVYITGDIKFHKALEVEGFAVIDIGHFESELPVLPLIQGLIAKTKVEVMIAKEEKPWVSV